MKVNLCKRDGAISYCRAKDVSSQDNCTYYKEASIGGRCMYFKFGTYCDNYWAQIGKFPPDSKLKSDPSAIYKPCEGCNYHKTCSKRATTAECDDEEKKKAGVKAFQ